MTEFNELTERLQDVKRLQSNYTSLDHTTWANLSDERYKLEMLLIRLGYLIKMQQSYIEMADRRLEAQDGVDIDAQDGVDIEL